MMETQSFIAGILVGAGIGAFAASIFFAVLIDKNYRRIWCVDEDEL